MNLKGIVISTSTLLLSLLLSWLAIRFMDTKKSWPKPTKVRRFIGFFLVFYILGALAYFGRYSHATDEALLFMESDDKVAVSKEGSTYFFNGPGETAALVFYPGAKVEAQAYAHIMHDIAERGVDTFVVEMPLHMAFLGRNNAAGIITGHGGYEKWYVGGHSLGGAMAGVFVATHPDLVDGLLLLAAYSTAPVSDDIDVVSVIGSNDTVVNMEEFNANKGNLPQDTIDVVIEGGNHAQYGDYGDQAGDSAASIDGDQQKHETVDAFYMMVD